MKCSAYHQAIQSKGCTLWPQKASQRADVLFRKAPFHTLLTPSMPFTYCFSVRIAKITTGVKAQSHLLIQFFVHVCCLMHRTVLSRKSLPCVIGYLTHLAVMFLTSTMPWIFITFSFPCNMVHAYVNTLFFPASFFVQRPCVPKLRKNSVDTLPTCKGSSKCHFTYILFRVQAYL